MSSMALNTGRPPARLSKRAALFLLGSVIFFSTGLHLYRLENIGDANLYYTAAVKSMLESWHNFFFVAAEPGAWVTVDKPPLGLRFVFTCHPFKGIMEPKAHNER